MSPSRCSTIIPIYNLAFIFDLLVLFTVWKVSVFRVFLVPFSCTHTEFRRIQSISRYSVQMPENTNQKNSKYRHYLCSDYHLILNEKQCSRSTIKLAFNWPWKAWIYYYTSFVTTCFLESCILTYVYIFLQTKVIMS